MARSPGDQLADWEIERYSSDLTYTEGNPDAAMTAHLTTQGLVIPLIEAILAKDPDVHSVLNIGVYIGNVDHYLAAKHPDIAFTGVDFWRDLDQANEPLLLPNFKVVRGYPLEDIEADTVSGDIAFFSSTATRIKNAELRRYIRSLAKRGTQYLIFNEPLFPLADGTIPNPRMTDPEKSTPIILYPVDSGDKDGGYPPCLCHNYPAIVTDRYEVIYSRLIHQPNPRFLMVAKRRT